MVRKTLLFLSVVVVISYSRSIESNTFGGITLPLGAELGFIQEIDVPKADKLKLLVKGSFIWSPIFDNKDVKSIIIVSLQPGLRFKLFDDNLLLSAGVSGNPVITLPFNGMDFGFGPFIGIGCRVKTVEVNLYGTSVLGREMLFNKIGWLSFTLSRTFTKSEKEKND